MDPGWLLVGMIGVQSLFVVIYLTLLRRKINRNHVNCDRANNERKSSDDGIIYPWEVPSHFAHQSAQLDRPSGKDSHSQAMAGTSTGHGKNVAGDPVSDQSKAVTGAGQQLDQDSSVGVMADPLSAGIDDAEQERAISHLERYRRLRQSKPSFWLSCDSRNAGAVGFCSASIAGKPYLADDFFRTCMNLAEISADCVRDCDSVTLNVIVKETCFGVLPYILYTTFLIMRKRLADTYGRYAYPDQGFLLVLLRDQSQAVVQEVRKVSEQLHWFGRFGKGSGFFSVILACSNLQILKNCQEHRLSFVAFQALFVANHPSASEAMRAFETALKRPGLLSHPTHTTSTNPELN